MHATTCRILALTLVLSPGVLSVAHNTIAEPIGQSSPSIGYTYQRPDGNRLVSGIGRGPHFQTIDIPLAGTPQWLVVAALGEGSLWVATLQNGQAQGFRVTGRRFTPVSIAPTTLPPHMPPLLIVEREGATRLGNVVTPSAATRTHPAVLDWPASRYAYITADGDLVVKSGDLETRLPVRALPDARVLGDERGRLLLLSDPTNRYRHGVLGDALEASSISLVETIPVPRVVLTIPVAAPAVIEGISPIWADLDGDGAREIIVTVSDPQVGARIVVFDESGAQRAAGPPIGAGFRWRHQLAVAHFGPNRELELVAVQTPHIGGTVEFYRLAGNTLTIVASEYGYSTHAIGSSNLDTAVAGDWDGDGNVEILIPNSFFNQLMAVRRTTNGIAVPWHLPAGGTLRTNLAAVRLSDGRVALGVGTDKDALRLWVP